jgi:hypothetical protein
MATKSTDFVANSIDQAIIKREGMTDLFIRFRSTGSIRATSCVGESTGRKQRNTLFEVSQLNRPCVAYERFPHCWFLYAGKAWSVKDCPVSVLKAALRNSVRDESAQELLSKSRDLDLITRWYVCCEAQSLRLFESQEKALQALQGRA